MRRLLGAWAWVLAAGVPAAAQGLHNPVLPGVADAGVIQFNGEYYIGGVGTDGAFYRSRDLLHWEGPMHVFSMHNAWARGPAAADRYIHSDDIRYLDGKFHLYWSVNYWGRDQNVIHIGHAVSDRVLGPYREPDTATWLSDRIDPMLFTDDDGRHYLYTVRFTDGNTIWVQPMADPGHPAGSPRYVFSSLPGTWETRDNRVAEGPWVIKYRGLYYMMYNANHTSTGWGNYALGVAVARSPMGFGHEGKYPYPVLTSNQVALEDRHADLLAPRGAEDAFRYAFTEQQGWQRPSFDDHAWAQGLPGFGSRPLEGSRTRAVGSAWDSGSLYLRRHFHLDSAGRLLLRVHHDGDTRVYLNGVQVYEGRGPGYRALVLDGAAARAWRKGGNVLAAQSLPGRGSRYLNLSLFDIGADSADDILFSPGQPNIVRGPNGLEWWLVYMANMNGERRGQYIDRVHFFDRRLFVDGITGPHSAGHHPPPAMPAFRDLFDSADAAAWRLHGGAWKKAQGEALVTGPGFSAFPEAPPATQYLFGAGMRLGGGAARAGLWAFRGKGDEGLLLLLDCGRRSWGYRLRQGDSLEEKYFPLPEDFAFGAYHTLELSRNGGLFAFRLDGHPAPGKHSIPAAFSGPALPGLWSEGRGTAFDGVRYTIGWDEYDEGIAGWENVRGRPWHAGTDGIGGAGEVFKGDALQRYEFGCQLGFPEGGRGGIYAAYADSLHYLRITLDADAGSLELEGMARGRSPLRKTLPLQRTSTYYADMRYSDFLTRYFTLNGRAQIDALDLEGPAPPGISAAQQVQVEYLLEGRWHRLRCSAAVSPHPGFRRLAFAPVRAEALRISARDPGDRTSIPYRVRVHEQVRDSYHLRIRRYGDDYVVFVDGQQAARLSQPLPPARVGLWSGETALRFNGITYFQLPKP